MKLRRNPSEGAEVASEALNDIMFFLLLFFLLISTMATPQIVKTELPEATAAKQMNKQPVALSVQKGSDETLSYFIGPTEVPFEQLEVRLQSTLKGLEEPTVVLRMDKGIKVAALREILKIGTNLKCKLVLATAAAKG